MLDAIDDGNDERPALSRKDGSPKDVKADVSNRMVYKLVKVCSLLLLFSHMDKNKNMSLYMLKQSQYSSNFIPFQNCRLVCMCFKTLRKQNLIVC